MLTVFMAAGAVCSYGDSGFALAGSTPEDGYAKVQSANVMVKLFFTEAVSGDADSSFFTFEDGEGNSVAFRLVANPNDQTNLNLLPEGDLTDDVTYTVTVSGDLESASGEVLGEDAAVSFSTKSSNMGVGYMVLMAIMVAVMVFTTVRENRKKEEAREAMAAGMENKVETNPYKLARERNISVQEASKIIAEEREKAKKKQEKLASRYGADKAAQAKGRGQDSARAARKSGRVTKDGRTVYRMKTKRIVRR